jgi:tetratricopeptide (TPR) repeat protein
MFTKSFLLALGDSYYQTGNCQKVCETYSKLHTKKALQSTLKKILRPLGECYEKTKNPLRAAEAYESYVSLPGVSDADASYLRAFLREKKDPKTAIAFYNANIKAFPKDSRNFIRLGMLYAEDSKSLSKATGPLSKAVMLNPKDSTVLLKLAEVWYALKNENKELNTYNQLLTLNPNHLTANKRVAELSMKTKQYAKAAKCLEIVHTSSPKDSKIMLMLAEAYLKTNQKSKAVTLLESVHATQKKNPELMLQLYTVYKELGKTSEAEKMIKQLITEKNDNKYRILYAGDLIDQKRYDEAKFVTDAIIKEEPMNLDGLMLSGRALGFLKKYDQAIENFKMASYVKDGYAPAFFERAEIYRKQKEYDRAETYYQKTLEIDPKNALAELGLARIYKVQNKMDLFKTHLDKAKAIDPTNKEIIAEEAAQSPAPAKPK